MFHASFVRGLRGGVVIHPYFAVVTPEHCVGLPELQVAAKVKEGRKSQMYAIAALHTSVMVASL